MTRSNHKRIFILTSSLATWAIAASSVAVAAPAPPAPTVAAADTAGAAPTVATAATAGTAAAGDPADPGAGTPTAATATAQPAAPEPRYPRAVIARPLTLPEGVAMLGADFTGNKDLSAMGGAPIVGYGITDDLEVQIPYVFATKDFEAKGSLNVDVGYKLLRGAVDGKLEVIARARSGYNLLTETANPLMIGAHAQYNITDTFAVISGFAGTQQLSIALSDGGVMGGPKPIDFSVPISFGYQPTPVLYLQLDTKLARFNISNSANAFIFADTTPIALTAVYNVINAVDVQASIGTDLSNAPGDALSFLVGMRFYAGKL